MASDPDTDRHLAAERSRRYRARQNKPRSPVIVLPIEIEHFQLIDALLDDRRITLAECDDRNALAAAVSRLVREWQKTVTRDASTPALLRKVRQSPEGK